MLDDVTTARVVVPVLVPVTPETVPVLLAVVSVVIDASPANDDPELPSKLEPPVLEPTTVPELPAVLDVVTTARVVVPVLLPVDSVPVLVVVASVVDVSPPDDD